MRTGPATLLLALAALAPGGTAPAAAADASNQAMSFALEDETPAIIAAHRMHDHGDRTVYASGAIVAGTTETLLAFIRKNRLEHARIYFDSPGGDVAESMKLGEELRSRHLNTAIGRPDDTPDEESEAICASACVFAYAGGENRFMPANSGRLGIHQFHGARTKAAIAETQLISGLIVAYLSHMGVDPNVFAMQAMVDPNSIMWLTPKQARALGFVNDGAQPTTAEITLVDMVPVLMLTQRRYDMEMSTAVICGVEHMRITTALSADYTDANHMRDLSRGYFELDGQLALDQHGPKSVSYDRGVVTVSRALSDETLARLLAANALALWVENGSGQRWGSAMDLRDVHDKMASYFTECTRINARDATTAAETNAAPAPAAARTPTRATAPARTAAPVSPAPAPAASRRPDLVIASRRVNPRAHELIFLDRASIVRRDNLATATGYIASLDDDKWSFSESSYTFACDALRYQSAGHMIDRVGQEIGDLAPTPWTSVPSGSAGDTMRLIACGKAQLEDWQIMDATDPYQAMRTFVAAVSREPRDFDGSKLPPKREPRE